MNDQHKPAVSESRVDEIVSQLYRRLKDWSKRGFGPDDVTWCEVRADVVALLASAEPAPTDAAITACALMIKGICMTRPQSVWVTDVENRIRFMLATAPPATLTNAVAVSNAKLGVLIESVRNYLGALDAWDGSSKAERYTKRKEIALRSAIASLDQEKPSDCSGDPASCPDNEGRGCYCSDKELIDRAAAQGASLNQSPMCEHADFKTSCQECGKDAAAQGSDGGGK
jgi:hypothetical protein